MGDFILLGPGGYFVFFFLPHWVPHLSQSSIFAIATSLPCWSTFEGVSQSTRRSLKYQACGSHDGHDYLVIWGFDGTNPLYHSGTYETFLPARCS